MSTLNVFAPAKINLGLSVLGVVPAGQPYAGYHRLHTLMLPLDVGDDLRVTPAPVLSLRVEGADLPSDSRNLVYRAARAYLDAGQLKGGAEIVLTKRLPLASGLGGGSSDAASALLALERLYGAGIDLPALAVRLGADVPFFLHPGPALVEGIGERRTPMTLPPIHTVLFSPGTAVSAADAYRWLDDSAQFTPPLDLSAILAALSLEALDESLEALDERRPLPYLNALETGVLPRHPEIAAALAELTAAGLHSPLMSGSGSTCFAVARNREHAEEAAEKLRMHHPERWIQAGSWWGTP